MNAIACDMYHFILGNLFFIHPHNITSVYWKRFRPVDQVCLATDKETREASLIDLLKLNYLETIQRFSGCRFENQSGVSSQSLFLF